MKRLVFVLGDTGIALAQADITHRIQSSVQFSVDGAGSVANRVPSYAVSGSNITLDTVVVLGHTLPGVLLGTLLALLALHCWRRF